MIIYKAVNIETGLCYIGQTIQPLKKRIKGHKTNPSGYFGQSIKKYGIECFNFTVIDRSATTMEELNKLEVSYIKKLNTLRPYGYNLQTGGKNKRTHDSTKTKLRYLKHFPIDCKCLKTGVTYSFFNASETKEIGANPDAVVAAIAKHRTNSGYYWKKRNEDFPKCMDEWIFKKEKTKFSNRSVANKGTKQSKEVIEKRTSKIKGLRRSESFKKAASELMTVMRGVKVVDSNGVVYKSITEASQKTGAFRSNIRKVLNGERKTTVGLSFEYVTKPEDL